MHNKITGYFDRLVMQDENRHRDRELLGALRPLALRAINDDVLIFGSTVKDGQFRYYGADDDDSRPLGKVKDIDVAAVVGDEQWRQWAIQAYGTRDLSDDVDLDRAVSLVMNYSSGYCEPEIPTTRIRRYLATESILGVTLPRPESYYEKAYITDEEYNSLRHDFGHPSKLGKAILAASKIDMFLIPYSAMYGDVMGNQLKIPAWENPDRSFLDEIRTHGVPLLMLDHTISADTRQAMDKMLGVDDELSALNRAMQEVEAAMA